jgi:hypothetical protein
VQLTVQREDLGNPNRKGQQNCNAANNHCKASLAINALNFGAQNRGKKAKRLKLRSWIVLAAKKLTISIILKRPSSLFR